MGRSAAAKEDTKIDTKIEVKKGEIGVLHR